MKTIGKFYLTVDQRDMIANDLLKCARELEADIEKKTPDPEVLEICEHANQTRRMLAALLKVEDRER